LEGQDLIHARDVLRLGVGDFLEVVAGDCLYLGKVENVNKELLLRVVNSRRVNRPQSFVALFQGVPKKRKFDWVVEKATELGVDAIYPVIFERTVPQIKGEKKLERWAKIIKEASQQSKREYLPSLSNPLKFVELIEVLKEYDAILVWWEGEKAPLKHTMGKVLKESPKVAVVVGPEGGLSLSEVEELRRVGAVTLSLGKLILKSETAGIVGLTLTLFELGRLA
jgi:16S rRNA (uracil1498-N3)-methyltransferase